MSVRVRIFRTATTTYGLKILLKGQLRFLSENNFEVYTASARGEWSDDLYNIEKVVKHYNINLQRKISLINDLHGLLQLYLVFKKNQPSIVHSITPKAGLLSMIAAFLAGVPIRIHTFTGLIFPYKSGLFRYVLKKMDKMLCLLATMIIAEGEGVKRQMIEGKVTTKPIRIIRNGNVNGVDSEFFKKEALDLIDVNSIKADLGIQKGDFVFLFVGRLVKDKGVNEMVSAFQKLSNGIENIKLLLVGKFEESEDPLMNSTKDLITNNKKIISIGFKNDVRPYYALSNVFLLPSYREGFPNVLLEAACFSLPIIATDIVGNNEIVKNGINGILIQAKNPLELKNAMNSMYSDERLRQNFSSCTRSMIVDKFKNIEVWEELCKVYQRELL